MTIKNLDNKTLARIKVVVFLLALIPLSRLVFGAYFETLGANPIEKITQITGYWALTFLLISLTTTPLRRILGWLWLIRLRRMLSLFAFFYACLHFLTYLVLDQFFDWGSIVKDIIKRPYITVGFPAFLLMIPMAITSTDKMIKVGWQTLAFAASSGFFVCRRRRRPLLVAGEKGPHQSRHFLGMAGIIAGFSSALLAEESSKTGIDGECGISLITSG